MSPKEKCLCGLRRAGSRAPLRLLSAPGAQRETALRVSLQVRRCRPLPAKSLRGAAKSRYDTACSWKLRKGAAGCESVREAGRRRREQVCLRLGQPAHLPLAVCASSLLACPSAWERTPACLKIQLSGQTMSGFAKPGPGEAQESAPSTEQLISYYLRQ